MQTEKEIYKKRKKNYLKMNVIEQNNKYIRRRLVNEKKKNII